MLELAPYDELTFGLWKTGSPHGMVLAPVAGREKDYDDGWEKEVAKYPVPVSFPGQGIKDRDVILGIEIGGQARAFPLDRVLKQSPVEDKIAGIPVALVTGKDGESVRVFRSQWNGSEIELYRDSQSAEWRLIDSRGNVWNFEGCAITGPATGRGLEKINFLKDFWFDWKNYHPQTTVYSR